MKADLFSQCYKSSIAGIEFNLPDGCKISDLPGNTKEDIMCDKVEAVADKLVRAIEEAKDNLLTYSLCELKLEDGEEKKLMKEMFEIISDEVKAELDIF